MNNIRDFSEIPNFCPRVSIVVLAKPSRREAASAPHEPLQFLYLNTTTYSSILSAFWIWPFKCSSKCYRQDDGIIQQGVWELPRRQCRHVHQPLAIFGSIINPYPTPNLIHRLENGLLRWPCQKAFECSPSPTFSQFPPQDTYPIGHRDCTILSCSRTSDRYEHPCNPRHQASSHRWAIYQSLASPLCFVDYALQSRHAIVKLMDEV